MTDYYDPRADWSRIPPHMHDGVKLYVMKGIPAGSFMMAVFSNDFMEAAGRADEKNARALYGWATFLYNFVPSQCKGSPAKVAAWIESGGIIGQQEPE